MSGKVPTCWDLLVEMEKSCYHDEANLLSNRVEAVLKVVEEHRVHGEASSNIGDCAVTLANRILRILNGEEP